MLGLLEISVKLVLGVVSSLVLEVCLELVLFVLGELFELCRFSELALGKLVFDFFEFLFEFPS